jgi:hypothetical protein
MKKELHPGIIATAALVAVVILGLVAWRMFSPPPPPADTPEARAAAKQMAEAFKNQAKAAQKMGAGGNGVAGSANAAMTK